VNAAEPPIAKSVRGPDVAADALIAAFAARRPLRAASFIVTIYGDAVVPRGGLVWLGSVIEVCALVGISETLVRTAVSRLVAAEHLLGLRRGRRSYYRLTAESLTTFQQAAGVIYAVRRPSSLEGWQLLALTDGPPDEAARRALGEAGFGLIAPGLAARPMPCAAAGATKLPPGLTFEATLAPESDRNILHRQVAAAWELESLAAAYRVFLDRYRPLAAALASGAGWSRRKLALASRLLLVHDYRHLVLADPSLPVELLPSDWKGIEASRLFASLYAALSATAEPVLDETLVDDDGPLQADAGILEERKRALVAE